MTQSHSRFLSTLMTSLLVIAAFLVGFQANEQRPRMKAAWAALGTPGSVRATLDDTGTLKPVQLFQEAFAHLQMEYVDPVEKPDELAYAAIRGMLYQLNDPYTRFMDPKEYKEFRSDNQGHFAGIGATLSMQEVPAQEIKDGAGTLAPMKCTVCGAEITNVKHYRVEIVEPLPKSPALAAGLQAHDIILKVNDKATDGMLVSEVASLIRGKEGTEVTLVLHRMNVEKPLTVTITRAQIEVPAVQTKMLDDNIGYLHLLSFNEKTVVETADALEQFQKAGVKGIVLDLRNNPGGLLTECIKVASMLLPADKRLIVQTKSRGGEKEDYNRINWSTTAYTTPLVVLVNKNSASASEILSGALKDYKRATIIGESTFGKALVQTVIPLSNGAAMAVTTAHYYTPSGYDVGKKGVAPDVAVELEKGATVSEKDNQAATAIRLLKEVMAKK